MNRVTEVEKELLELAPAEREQLALRAWESLVDDEEAQSDSTIDAEGIALAMNRDSEIDSGNLSPVSKEEFLRRTSGE